MQLRPRSLLARTAMVIAIALAASQLASVVMFRYYSQPARVQLVAAGFIAHLKTVRAALESLPAEQHADFLKRLRDERGVRVLRARAGETLERAPDVPALRAARLRLRDEFGSDADVFIRPAANPANQATLIVKLLVAEREFWVVFPRSRVVEPDFSWAWLGWAVFGAVLTLFGAVLLVMRVTRPLEQLAKAARELGQGRNPDPLAIVGPTEVQAVAAAFNQMRDDLARNDRERATFLAGVSHDLRTPLARLRLDVEMLPADPATRKEIEQDITDINAIIDQFMDYARDERIEPTASVDLNLVIQDVAARSQRMGVPVTFELAALPLLTLRPQAMRRLISNLLDNATKHAGTAITVATLVHGDEIWFSVMDRGPGIPHDEVDNLLKPFTRLDAARSGKSGAGLGLAIVERIARAQGGRLELLPRHGGGLEARVVLPVTTPR